MKKATVTILAVAVAVVLAAAAAVFLLVKPTLTPAREPYVIGAFFSITGPAAPLGTPERDTLLMLAEEINAAGGINGHELKVIIEDDGSDPTNAVKAVKKLLEQDGVIGIIGGSSTGTTKAVIPLIQEAQKPFITCCAGSVGVTDPVIPWVFRTPQTDKIMVEKILEYLNSIGITKVATIYDSNAYGTGGRDQIRLLAPAYGVTVVAEESFNTTDTDLTIQLTKAKNAGAQTIICWGTNPAPAILTRNRIQLGIDIPLIQSHGVANEKFLELSGDAAEGIIMPAGKLFVAEGLPESDPQRRVLLSFASAFQQKYGRGADTFGGHAWDGFKAMVAALEKAGTDAEALRKAIENLKDFAGIGGVFTYAPDDHDGLTKEAVVLLRVENGAFKLFRR